MSVLWNSDGQVQVKVVEEGPESETAKAAESGAKTKDTTKIKDSSALSVEENESGVEGKGRRELAISIDLLFASLPTAMSWTPPPYGCNAFT